MKRKSSWLYLDGERAFDALEYALERRIMLAEAKDELKREYEGKKIVDFRVEV